MRTYTPNLTEEKVGNNLKILDTEKDFLNRAPIAQALWSAANKWGLTKLKSFCITKDFKIQTEWQPAEWEKIFTNSMYSRGLISRMYKRLKNRNKMWTLRKQITRLKMRYRYKLYLLRTEGILNRGNSNGWETLKEIRKTQIKTTQIPPYTRSKPQVIAQAGKDVEQGEHSIAGRRPNLYNHYGN